MLSRINKETNKVHKNLSEGVETLILNYKTGNAEVWDGDIKINGVIEKDVKDYYEEGYQAGLNESGRIIYGAYILDAVQTPVTNKTVMLSEPDYVYGNFYTGTNYVKDKIGSITISPSIDLVTIKNGDESKTIKYNQSEDVWSYIAGNTSGVLPNAIGRMIEFTEPEAVDPDFFGIFDDISSTNVEGTVIEMVEQRLINVAEEGM